jgi:lipoprotein NlpD
MNYFIGKLLRSIIKCCCLLAIIGLSGCVPPKPVKFPPVVEGWRRAAAGKNAYIVQKKDTLYSIAWALGLDYRDLAEINNLAPPYSLHRGQRIYIVSSRSKKSVHIAKTIASSYTPSGDKTFIASLKGWVWPAHGKVVKGFDNKLGGNRGVDIQGGYGSAVLASNSGNVVYSGTGIRSYGKLLIIKHSDDYLSAYAYNAKMLVREGQKVKAGQKIATMGRDDEGRVALHFEIRRIGKPINPLLYLPKKS